MNDREERQRQERIRVRAYHLWEQDGRPEGRADVYWDQATELVAIEDNQRFATERVPRPDELGPTGEPIEPAEAMENLGEFPTMTDQGEEQTFPQRATPEPPAEKPASAKPKAKASPAPAGNRKAGRSTARDANGKSPQ
jgi:Protein of unknown function (DUF2934)